MSFLNDYYIPADPEHIKRERRKAQELRQGSWWKQQVGPGICHHCGGKFPKEQLTMDHLIPVARGGKSSKNNCVPCCKECNTAKGASLESGSRKREFRQQTADSGFGGSSESGMQTAVSESGIGDE